MPDAMHPKTQEIVAKLDADAREAWEERAAIREHDGGYERWEAERLALEDLAMRKVRGKV